MKQESKVYSETNRLPIKPPVYNISDALSKRINILKLWLIIMVVFIHSYTTTVNFVSNDVSLVVPQWLEIVKYIISQCISRCAVPAFFMISAILLYRKPFKWKNNLVKKTKTLLVPYLILNTFWILFYFVCQHIPMLSDYFSNPDNIVAEWGIGKWISVYLFEPFLYPLWFVRNLFLLNIFSKVIKFIVDKIPWLSLIVAFLVWYLLPFSVNKDTIFWVFGCFIVNKNINLNALDRIPKSLMWVLYAALIAADVITRNLFFNNYIHGIAVICGIIFFFVCLTDFKEGKFKSAVLAVSSYSFGIYLFHEQNLSILRKLCTKFLPQTALIQTLEYFLIPAFIIFACIILCMILNKIAPKFYAVLVGNRKQ